MSDLTREKVEWCRMQGCTCEEENQDPKCWWCCTCDMALRSLDGVVPSINVKVEIPMPPYAGGVWYAEVVRVEQENNGSFTAVIHSTRAAASEQDARPCTCHPDDNPPVPCPRKYALAECRKAADAFWTCWHCGSRVPRPNYTPLFPDDPQPQGAKP